MGSKTCVSGGGLGIGDHENENRDTDGDVGSPPAWIGVGDGDRCWDDAGSRVPADVLLAVVANSAPAQSTLTVHGSVLSSVTLSLDGPPSSVKMASIYARASLVLRNFFV